MKLKYLPLAALLSLGLASAVHSQDDSDVELCTLVHGAHIRSSDGADIGTVNDLVIDRRSGRILHVVVATSEDHLIALPYSEVNVTNVTEKNVIVVNSPRERIVSAPAFTQTELRSLNRETINRSVSYFSSSANTTTNSRSSTNMENRPASGAAQTETSATVRENRARTNVETSASPAVTAAREKRSKSSVETTGTAGSAEGAGSPGGSAGAARRARAKANTEGSAAVTERTSVSESASPKPAVEGTTTRAKKTTETGVAVKPAGASTEATTGVKTTTESGEATPRVKGTKTEKKAVKESSTTHETGASQTVPATEAAPQ
jgi:sporulation protein YlmC with PRC-barrel domain